MSPDPALGSYVGSDPAALPGLGGVFQPVNLSLYHYAGNNPVRYFDPTGLSDEDGLPTIATISAASAEDFRKPWYSQIPLVSDFLRGGYFFLTGTAGGEEGVTDPLSGDVMFPGEAQDAARGFFFAVAGAAVGAFAKAGTAAASYVDDTAAALEHGTTLALPPPDGVPNAGGAIRSFVTKAESVYYRVFSKNPAGRFLTKVAPGSRATAIEGLALPPSNQADFIQRVVVPAGTRLQRSRALAAFGHRGGMEQFELLQRIPSTAFGPGVPFR